MKAALITRPRMEWIPHLAAAGSALQRRWRRLRAKTIIVGNSSHLPLLQAR